MKNKRAIRRSLCFSWNRTSFRHCENKKKIVSSVKQYVLQLAPRWPVCQMALKKSARARDVVFGHNHNTVVVRFGHNSTNYSTTKLLGWHELAHRKTATSPIHRGATCSDRERGEPTIQRAALNHPVCEVRRLAFTRRSRATRFFRARTHTHTLTHTRPHARTYTHAHAHTCPLGPVSSRPQPKSAPSGWRSVRVALPSVVHVPYVRASGKVACAPLCSVRGPCRPSECWPSRSRCRWPAPPGPLPPTADPASARCTRTRPPSGCSCPRWPSCSANRE